MLKGSVTIYYLSASGPSFCFTSAMPIPLLSWKGNIVISLKFSRIDVLQNKTKNKQNKTNKQKTSKQKFRCMDKYCREREKQPFIPADRFKWIFTVSFQSCFPRSFLTTGLPYHFPDEMSGFLSSNKSIFSAELCCLFSQKELTLLASTLLLSHIYVVHWGIVTVNEI